MSFRAVLAVVLLSAATVEASSGGVDVWKTGVTMTCPEEGKWYYDGMKPNPEQTKEKYFSVQYKDKGIYHCEYGDGDKTKYYFYMQGKVCEDCYELDALLFGGVIIVDIIGTAVLMVIVYKCTKKKTPTGPKQSTNRNTPARPGDLPITPSTYEHLNPHTRNEDPYSMINRTG